MHSGWTNIFDIFFNKQQYQSILLDIIWNISEKQSFVIYLDGLKTVFSRKKINQNKCVVYESFCGSGGPYVNVYRCRCCVQNCHVFRYVILVLHVYHNIKWLTRKFCRNLCNLIKPKHHRLFPPSVVIHRPSLEYVMSCNMANDLLVFCEVVQ